MGKSKKGKKEVVAITKEDVEREAARNYAEWLGPVDRCSLVADKLDTLCFLLGMADTLDSPSDSVVNGLVVTVSEGADAIRELCEIVMRYRRAGAASA